MKRLIHANKIHLIIFIVLTAILCCAGTAVAQTRVNWSGDKGPQTINEDMEITLTGNVNINGTITITGNHTVTIKNTSDTKYQMARRMSEDQSDAMFRVNTGSTLTVTGKAITSNYGYNIEVRGGTGFTNDDARTTSTTTHNYGLGPVFYAYGNLTIKNVAIFNTYSESAGAVYCRNNANDASQTLSLTNVKIFAIKADLGSGVYFGPSDNHIATLKNVEIYKCYAYATDKAGTIRTYGDARTQLTLDGCNIHDNWSDARGGGIYWNAGGSNAALLTIKGNTLIQNNKSRTNSGLNFSEGGGIFLTGGMDLQSATISGNEAKYGGGIFMDTYDGGVSAYNGQAFNLIMKDNVTVSDNTATVMGGGVMLRIRESKDVGYNSSGNPVDVTFGFDMQGGSITGNHAPQGAGVAIDDDAPQKVKYNNVESGLYSRDVKISGGSINSNTTTGTTNVRGGGVYIYKHVTTGNHASNNFGDIPIVISGGTIYSNTATLTSGTGSVTNGSGGGVYILNSVPNNYTSTCSVTVSGTAQIYGNSSTYAGGGIYLNGGTFTMNNGHVGQNSSGTPSANRSANGAGFYIDGGTCNIYGGNIKNNIASSNGGGFYVDPGNSATTTINSSQTTTIVASNQAANGGGVYVKTGSLNIGSNATEIKSNTATTDGAGVYVAGGSCTLTSGYIHDNDATRNGGGIYMGGGNFAHSGGQIGKSYGTNGATANTAVDGAGIYMNGGTYTFSGGYIYGNKATGNGGGVYMHGGIFSFNGGRIGYGSGNNRNTANNGAGVYMGGTSGVFQMPDTTPGVTVGSPSIEGNYATANGGGIYMASGTCSITTGTIGSSASYHNEAVNGGGIYSASGTGLTVAGGSVNYNKASTSGGGLYVAGAMYFSDGDINHNTATSGNGGGVCIASTGSFSVSGTAEMTGNSVPSGQGGGVYQGGTMNADGTSLTITGNTKGTAKAVVANNVYLPQNKTIAVGNGIDPESVHLGITTYKIADIGEDIPVLTGNDAVLSDIYDALVAETSQIKDDQNKHKPKYPGAAANTLYFTRIQFDHGPYNGQTFSNPINTQEKLYRFMCYVNGVNGFSGTQPDAVGNITADIDMTGVEYWMPIGESTAFIGTLTGNGHTISGLSPDLLTHSADDYGLFGVVASGAQISDVFVTSCDITKNNSGTLGCLIGKMTGGTVNNCEGAGTLSSNDAACIIGGLVGQMTGGTVHSSSAMADMTGYTMGGLVGNNSGNLYNSFANPKFTYSGAANAYFVGGLVAVNTGTVQNCYSRFSRTSSFANTAKFGRLAGSAGSNLISQCYTPATCTTVPAAIKNTGTVASSCTTYSNVIAPYLYNRTGDNIVGSGSTSLEATLNAWVDSHSGYAPWKRTTAGGYSSGAGNINGDYPIHKYSGYTCVASPDGIVLDYAPSLDAMLARHTSDATINLYAHDRTISSTGNNMMVYIDENVSLLQDVGSSTPSSNIVAYTCQTIPGTPRSWHYLSSSLSNSTIGFSYGQDALFNWDTDPCLLNFSSDDDHALFPSDMPAVSSMDLYCFYEPEYHWINFKRNSNSHWHLNATDVPIIYSNESTLTPGKGYLVSIDQDQLLQNRGTLNNGDITIALSYTEANAWAGLLGYNLIGNPYQSYLSFNRFAADNNAIWSGRGVEPTYAVYDDAMGGYIQYKEGSSRGARAASGTLNMHQGFLVRTASASSITFTNAMRTNDGEGVTFREEQPAYPLINLKVTDDQGVNDFAVLELGRNTDAGAEKLRANDSKGWIYLRHDGESYGILFRSDVDNQPLCFEATEAGNYTLSWETANGEFEALTLVDNINGTKTDMLATHSYVFEADPEQYASRFKIVIGDWKDIDEYNEDDLSASSATFAFMNNGTLVVNGEGRFEIVDMLGRVIRVEELHDSQSMIPMPQGAAGIYVLQLTNDGATKVQKIVVE